MAARSSVGWLILLAALAVPGFMFYTWWSNLNSAKEQQMSQRVRKRLPEGGSLFADSPAQDKLTNPIAASTAAATGRDPGPGRPDGSPAEGGTAQAAASAPADLDRELAALAQSAAPAGPPPAEPPPEAAPPAAPPAGVVIARDPTLSPYDKVRIEQLALERQLRQFEVKEAADKPKPREPGIETKIALQGIITTQTGQKAIVNGEMVGEGDMVGEVKVVSITPQGVVFAHKNRRFRKTISK